MRKSELFDRCVFFVEDLLQRGKLRIKTPYNCPANVYFARECKIHSGIVVSTSESEAGIITRAWAIVFVNPDLPRRCTEIHTSYYGESLALNKLWNELESYK